MSIPVITFIGASGCGKTTLMEKLIPELRGKGYHVATIKHHSHPGFEIDQLGKDSWRHAQAGSEYVVIAAPDKLASYRHLERELTLDEIVDQIEGVDIILVEGYKNAGKPSIEIIRGDLGIQILGNPDHLIAIASNVSIDAHIPVFNLQDASGIADFIEAGFLKK